MTIIRFIVTNSFEGLQQVVFGQHRASKDTHNLNNGSSDFEVMLDDSHKTVSDDSHRNLCSDNICNPVKNGYFCRDVNLGMDFDARLGTTEMSPTEDGHTDVDYCGIDSVEASVKFKLHGDTPLLGKKHHMESELLEDSRVSKHICFRESVSDNGGITESELIGPFGMRCGEVCETSERRAPHKLPKDKNQQMIPMGEAPITSTVVVPEATFKTF